METSSLAYYRRLKKGYPVLNKPAFDTYHAQLPNKQIEEILIRSNIGLVITAAFAYNNRDISLDDLLQEGFIGLQKGITRYDPKAGCKPATYLTWWIKQPIRKALREKTRLIRAASHSYNHARAYQSFILAFEEEHGRAPTTTEVLQLAPEFKHHDARNKTQSVLSIDNIHRPPHTFKEEDTPETSSSSKERTTLVRQFLEILPPRERYILQAIYWEGQSAKTIGNSLPDPVSRTRVLQIRDKSIDYLRRALTKQHLTAADI